MFFKRQIGTINEIEISVNLRLMKNMHYRNIEDLNGKEITLNQSLMISEKGSMTKITLLCAYLVIARLILVSLENCI